MSTTNAPPPNLKVTGRYKGAGSMLDLMPGFTGFFSVLAQCLQSVQATAGEKDVNRDEALTVLESDFRRCHKAHGTVLFIGNGGSAGIASHLATDYTKNGKIRARALNDPTMLTCLANDFKYEDVFAKQLAYYATPRDLVVFISSSGKSPNILKAATYAIEKLDRQLVTFSGMNPDNPLRSCGYLNFYVPCEDYGLIELSHMALLHSIISKI